MAGAMIAFLRTGLVLAGMIVSSWAFAGSLQVNPVRIFLSAQNPVAVITVHNDSAAAKVIQLEGVSWQQSAGEDIYVPTQEVLATPPIFTIAAGSTQIVRVGLRRQPDSRRELTYRLFLQEVPTAAAKEGQIRMVLRFGIPVFVASAGTAPRPLLEWRAVISPQKALRIEAINHGNAHVQISGFTLAAADDNSLLAEHQGMNYLLPEQGHQWLIAADQDWPPGTRLKIVAQTDAGKIDAEMELVEH